MMPTEQAALRTLNIGSTVPIMMSKPLPSSPSIAVAGTRTPSAETGDESLPRSPSPSNGPWTRMPGVSGRHQPERAQAARPPAPAATTRRTRSPWTPTSPSSSARRATISSPSRLAVPTGAQKWLRDPASLNASVLRCAPLAAASRTSRGPKRFEDGGAAVVHAHHHRGRAAFLGEASDDGRGAAEAEAEPADLRRADGAHQAGGGQRIQRSFGKRAVLIDVRRVGADGLGANLFQRGGIVCGVWRHAHLVSGRRGKHARGAALRRRRQLWLETFEPWLQLKTRGAALFMPTI